MSREVLVYRKKNDLFVASDVVAQQSENSHRSVIRLIEKYKMDFEEFGGLAFRMLPLSTKGGIQMHKIYELNEQQVMLIFTYLRNNPIVREFKKRIVKEFYRMRAILLEQQSLAWKDTRQQGKTQRKLLTDSLQVLEGIFINDGSKNGRRLYSQYTSMINKALGIKERDESNTSQLAQIAFLEDLCSKMILMHIAQETNRKEIYYICKEQVETITSISKNALLAIGV